MKFLLRTPFPAFLFLCIISLAYSTKYKIFEIKSEIAFHKINQHNTTLIDKKVDGVSNDVLSTSVLSIIVTVPKSDDCIKKSIVLAS